MSKEDTPSNKKDSQYNNRNPFLTRRRYVGSVVLGTPVVAGSSILVSGKTRPQIKDLYSTFRQELRFLEDLFASASDALLIDYRRERVSDITDSVEQLDEPFGKKRNNRGKNNHKSNRDPGGKRAILTHLKNAKRFNTEAGEAVPKAERETIQRRHQQAEKQLSIAKKQLWKYENKTKVSTESIRTQIQSVIDARGRVLEVYEEIKEPEVTERLFAAFVESRDAIREVLSTIQQRGKEITVTVDGNSTKFSINPIFTTKILVGGGTLLASGKILGIAGVRTVGAAAAIVTLPSVSINLEQLLRSGALLTKYRETILKYYLKFSSKIAKKNAKEILKATAEEIVEQNPEFSEIWSQYNMTDNGLNIDEGLSVSSRPDPIVYYISGDKIKQYSIETDQASELFPAPTPSDKNALAFGDGSLWFADATSGNFDGRILELNPETGAKRSEINLGVDITGLAFGDGSLWAADITGNNIIEFSPEGDQLSSFSVNTIGPQGLAYRDGGLDPIYLLEGADETIRQYTEEGEQVDSFTPDSSNYRALAANSRVLLGANPDGDLILLQRFGVT